jgi:hypothetical protein
VLVLMSSELPTNLLSPTTLPLSELILTFP